jgi:hypothetical protein
MVRNGQILNLVHLQLAFHLFEETIPPIGSWDIELMQKSASSSFLSENNPGEGWKE